jgi:hypothetical protein
MLNCFRVFWGAAHRCAIAVVGLFLLPGFVSARTYACYGTVDQLTVSPAGVANASFTFDSGGMAWQDLCNVSVDALGVSAASCKAIYATLMAAHVGNRRVMMWFSHPSQSCATQPWKPIRDMGWYWGPAIVK